MHFPLVVTLFLWSGVAASAETASAEVRGAPSCESQISSFESRDIMCSLNTAGASRRFRLQVNFSGGHDDTDASLAPTLNGAVVACEDGSKTHLMGEDGDVSLVCIVSVPEKKAVEQLFKARVSWRHAQYVDYQFSAY